VQLLNNIHKLFTFNPIYIYCGKLKNEPPAEKSGGSPASAYKKSLYCHFMEKASMENHFGFWSLKSPQTRMNTKKNVPDSKIRHIIWWGWTL
jgi:hypothetical protein